MKTTEEQREILEEIAKAYRKWKVGNPLPDDEAAFQYAYLSGLSSGLSQAQTILRAK